MEEYDFKVQITLCREISVTVKASNEIEAELEAIKQSGVVKKQVSEMRVTSENYDGEGTKYDSDWYPIDDDVRKHWG